MLWERVRCQNTQGPPYRRDRSMGSEVRTILDDRPRPNLGRRRARVTVGDETFLCRAPFVQLMRLDLGGAHGNEYDGLVVRSLRSLLMPSPFPGVDPYLEAKGLWESFHALLACALRGAGPNTGRARQLR
jgi:hypothetical protein